VRFFSRLFQGVLVQVLVVYALEPALGFHRALALGIAIFTTSSDWGAFRSAEERRDGWKL
jgi:hypothetical protein